ncbi:hypothetical protein [Acidovorax sp. NO-1]|uniref:hypothetical protein n=1 Tax=Acidovorax sp. NO-1 TaxID=512030 RepID=UPI00054FE744|nr:hypothetical protein [Acidovorax sp. NO-1]
MRKNVLSLSIAAMIGGLGFAGAASAGVSVQVGEAATVMPNPTAATSLVMSADGVGHNLLTPYYSVQNGNGTLLSIVNTDTKSGKAVKVRFRGAANSDDVFDFTVLMSPGDVWTANVYKGEDGLARIFTPDNSCTLPRRSTLNATSFKTDRVFGADDAAKAVQTLEGYVEIFNMADIPPTLPGTAAGGVVVGAATTFANPLYTAIKHVAGKNPCGSTADGVSLPAAVLALQANPATAAAVNNAATAADDKAVLDKGLWSPTSGLMGSWTILNQSSGFVSWSANMVAVEARAGTAKSAGRVVFSPQMDTTVAGDVINLLTSDPLLRTPTGAAGESGIVAAAEYDLPDMSTPYVLAANLTDDNVGAAQAADKDKPLVQARLLTASLAVKNVMNEYVTNPLIEGQTDWVFSMPTRRYAVGVNYAAATKPAAVFNSLSGVGGTGVAVVDNISKYFTSVNTKMGTAGTSGNPTYQACVETGAGASTVTAYDQEETSASSDFVVSPGTAKKVVFCGETSVLTVNSTSSLGATIAAKDIQTGFASGWMNIATTGNSSLGLPVIGHAFVKMTGNAVDGKSTNYSITQEHRYTR